MNEPVPPRDTGPRPAGKGSLRCLVVTSALDVGGMDEVAAFLGRRLPEHGLATAVLHAISSPPPGGEPAGRLGRMLRSSGTQVHTTGEAGALTWIGQWHPDVISAHGAPHWVVSIAHQLGVPMVDTLHGMHAHFSADWAAEADRAAEMSAIVSVSELVREQYRAGNPRFAAQRIVTIPNGVDEQRRVSRDRAAVRSRLGLTREYVFVSLARHSLQKNSYALIVAFAELALQHPQAHLVIAGFPSSTRYYRRMRRLRDELPCRDRIHLRNHASAPATLLAAADGFVLDSFFEGWSLASMEALYAGVPAVLSDVGGAREQLGNVSGRGYLVPNPLGDPLAVNWESMSVAKFRRQLNRPALVTAMGELISQRDDYLSHRDQLAAESAARFSADTCLARHAAVLASAARGEAVNGAAAVYR